LWWKHLSRNSAKLVSAETVEKFLCKREILTETFNLKVLSQIAGMPVIQYFTYENLIWILAKPILSASLENACAFLSKEKSDYAILPLPLKISRYTRAACISSIKKYKKLPENQKEIVKSVNKLTNPLKYSKPNSSQNISYFDI